MSRPKFSASITLSLDPLIMTNIPATPGTYILWLHLNRKRRITIGRLGEQLFLPGFYAYCGSAFGPGGLQARLGHHLKKTTRPHWHIDYLKAITSVSEIWLSTEPENLEHQWSQTLSRLSGAAQPFAGFGASDCKCTTHLIFFAEQPEFKTFQEHHPDKNSLRQVPG